MTEQAHQPVELEHLQGDQEVYGSDGKKIGMVEGLTIDLDTGEQYLEVHAPLLKTIYVPRDAIEYAILGEPVRLKVPHDEALERFSLRPNIL